jgi:hypothetical protein
MGLDGLLFGSGGVSVAVAIILAKLIWNKWFSGDDKATPEGVTTSRSRHATIADLGSLQSLIEVRFSQQHSDLKALKDAADETRDTLRWLKEAHDQRDADGSFRWWNKHTVENKIAATYETSQQIVTRLKARQDDAAQAKADIIAAVNARRRNGG